MSISNIKGIGNKFAFFEDMPYEITINILNFLNLNSILRFSETSHSNRYITLNCRKITKKMVCQNLFNVIKSIPEEHKKEQYGMSSFESFLASVVHLTVDSNPDRAIELANSIKDEDNRSEAIRSIAEELAKINPDRAIELSNTIQDVYEKNASFQSIIEELAKTNPERAIELAKALENEGAKNLAVTFIAKELAKTNLERATELATSVSTPWYQGLFFLALSDSFTETNHNYAVQFLTRAKEVVNQMDLQIEKVALLSSVLKMEPKIAPSLLRDKITDAINDARTIKDTCLKLKAFAYIVAGVPRTHVEFAQNIFDQMVEEVNMAKDVPTRVKDDTYRSIAKAQAKLDPEKALYKVAKKIEDPTTKTLTVFSIFKYLNETNSDLLLKAANKIESPDKADALLREACIALAKINPDSAFELVSTIQEESHRDIACLEIIKALAYTNPSRALELANASKNEDTKAEAFCIIAKGLAKTDPHKALELAFSIKNPDLKYTALISIKRVIDGALPEEAMDIFVTVMNFVNTLKSAKEKAILLSSIARKI